MTLLAIWYRKEHGDLYAIADSRLLNNGELLSDRAPKFSLLSIRCYAPVRNGGYDRLVLNRELAIGYTGSTIVAQTTVATA